MHRLAAQDYTFKDGLKVSAGTDIAFASELIGIDLEIADAVVRDDVMIGTVNAKWRLRYLGREIEDCVLLTDIWVRDGDRWRVIRRHSSPALPRSREAVP